ncbi:MAG: hypothetical protein VXW87_03535 [Pseudomonadota bacterium]|nr:hypothetical protein [Pseudomonadota bacterium]
MKKIEKNLELRPHVVRVLCDIDGVVYNKIAYHNFIEKLKERYICPESGQSKVRGFDLGDHPDLQEEILVLWKQSIKDSFSDTREGKEFHVFDALLHLIHQEFDGKYAECQLIELVSGSARLNVGLDSMNAFHRMRESGGLGILQLSNALKSKFSWKLYGTPFAMEVVQEMLLDVFQRRAETSHVVVNYIPELLSDHLSVVDTSDKKDLSDKFFKESIRDSKLPIVAFSASKLARLTVLVDDRAKFLDELYSQQVVDTLPGVVGMGVACIHIDKLMFPVESDLGEVYEPGSESSGSSSDESSMMRRVLCGINYAARIGKESITHKLLGPSLWGDWLVNYISKFPAFETSSVQSPRPEHVPMHQQFIEFYKHEKATDAYESPKAEEGKVALGASKGASMS